MPLSKQMERLLCSFFGRFPVSEFVHKKKRLMAGLKLAELRGFRKFGCNIRSHCCRLFAH